MISPVVFERLAIGRPCVPMTSSLRSNPRRVSSSASGGSLPLSEGGMKNCLGAIARCDEHWGVVRSLAMHFVLRRLAGAHFHGLASSERNGSAPR